jgi:hypothetical protein
MEALEYFVQGAPTCFLAGPVKFFLGVRAGPQTLKDFYGHCHRHEVTDTVSCGVANHDHFLEISQLDLELLIQIDPVEAGHQRLLHEHALQSE